jgi:hypothetical protein
MNAPENGLLFCVNWPGGPLYTEIADGKLYVIFTRSQAQRIAERTGGYLTPVRDRDLLDPCAETFMTPEALTAKATLLPRGGDRQ